MTIMKFNNISPETKETLSVIYSSSCAGETLVGDEGDCQAHFLHHLYMVYF